MFLAPERLAVDRIQILVVRRQGEEEGVLDAGRPMDLLQGARFQVQPVGMNAALSPAAKAETNTNGFCTSAAGAAEASIKPATR